MGETQVWKFELEMIDEQVVHMPDRAEILCAQVQNGVPCIWAKVSISDPMRARHIRIAGTGHALEGKLLYIDTFQLHGGHVVFHVFEKVVG